MLVLFSGQVPKDACYPNDNEDAFCISEDTGRVAVSDGASESFDSKSWACLLTNLFVSKPEMNLNWLTEAIAEYVSHINPSELSWSKQASYSRGSFATLLGIEECKDDGSIDVLSVGDSLAVLLNNREFSDSFPYKRAEEFQQRPELFCTNPFHNSFITTGDFLTGHLKTWKLDSSDAVVLCMTDALGEWAFRCDEGGQPAWGLLAQIRNVHELEDLVVQERQRGNMRTDDTTLISLSFPSE